MCVDDEYISKTSLIKTNMSDPTAFSVTQLKEFLRDRGLSTAGAKTELITRLVKADPTDEWMGGQSTDDTRRVGGNNNENMRREDLMRPEIDVYRREKEIVERELEIARREIALLQERQDMGPVSCERREAATARDDDSISTVSHPRLSLTAVADLLADFDGDYDGFVTWEKQIILLKTTYRLDDDHAKILIGMRLKKRALDWFHSKSEFISMTFDVLMLELRAMFGQRQNKIAIRRRFEARVWRRDETFRECTRESNTGKSCTNRS